MLKLEELGPSNSKHCNVFSSLFSTQMTGTLEKAPILPKLYLREPLPSQSSKPANSTLLIYSKSAHFNPNQHYDTLSLDILPPCAMTYNHRPALPNSMPSSTSGLQLTYTSLGSWLPRVERQAFPWPSLILYLRRKILKVSDNFCLFTMINSTQPST